MNSGTGRVTLPLAGLIFWVQSVAALPTLQPVGAWPLPGRAEQPSALAWDPVERRLFVAAEAADSVWVLEVDRGRWLRPLSVPAPRHLLCEARSGLLYVSSGAEGGQVKILDINARRTLKTIGNLPRPGHIHRDAPAARIYVAHGEGALAVIHGVTGVHTLSVLLPDRPADFAIETVGHRIFVNLPRSNAVAVVDRLAREMTDLWPLPQARQNESLALEEPRQRLYVGCALPPEILVLNSTTGKVLTRLPTTGPVRWIRVDPVRGRLMAGHASGLQSWRIGSDDRYEPLPASATGLEPIDACYDADTGRLYVVVRPTAGRAGSVQCLEWKD
jgi:DNA-binding beta-propeller fold protein YncE